MVGAALRFTHLGTESLWNDEVSSWHRSNVDSLAAVLRNASHDVHTPGSHLLVYVLLHNVGDSEAILRLPSAIGGVLALVAIYFLGRRLYSPREGLLAAAEPPP